MDDAILTNFEFRFKIKYFDYFDKFPQTQYFLMGLALFDSKNIGMQMV